MKKAICIDTAIYDRNDRLLEVNLLKVYEYFIPYHTSVQWPYHIIDERHKRNGVHSGYPISKTTFEKCFLKIK